MASRLPIGSSDPVSFTCTCPASSDPQGGLVLLFYRYFAASPPLPNHSGPSYDISSLAAFHSVLTEKYRLGGKIRVAKEGFNITVGGTRLNIEAYMEECISHWSFQGLDLDSKKKQTEFFKPTVGGCACAFGDSASVRVTSEITPMGVTNYVPDKWDQIEVLSPEEFHERCHGEPNALLLDVRNYYESRIGYFIDPKTGLPALRPAIRRFSQWPQYVRKYMTGESESNKGNVEGRQIMTFCTGGIRCEKGARYLEENMTKRSGDKVATLKGGIASYLAWMDEEIKQGRKNPEDSLFKGRNYVFDARGSTALHQVSEPVSNCHLCASPSYRLSKCRSKGCHLVLVICASCEYSADPRCCQSCLELDLAVQAEISPGSRMGPRSICSCEQTREEQLWGGDSMKLPKRRKAKTENISRDRNGINIQVTPFDQSIVKI